MKLPAYDPVQIIINDEEDPEMELKSTSVWWASKELIPGKLLSDFVGKNEKTKIIAKLQKVRFKYIELLIIIERQRSSSSRTPIE